MNIFYLSSNAKQAAVYHNDKHVVKMILESAQLLSTAHRVLDIIPADSILYKATHIHHPSAKWARDNINNYQWLYDLFCGLCEEYTFRYSKTHLTESKLKHVLKQAPMNISTAAFTQPPQAMPIELHSTDSINAYRTYYITRKSHLARWTKREIPFWYKDNKDNNAHV
jgi:hypothetical protein